MKTKIKVEYLGGESRYANNAVDYMLAIVPGEYEDIELYAELEVTCDENGNYDRLCDEITAQAKEKGIDVHTLNFFYDEEVL